MLPNGEEDARRRGEMHQSTARTCAYHDRNACGIGLASRHTNTEQMKPLSIVSILAISALGTLSTGCGKYEDGPDFSLRSRASRIANTWKVESARKGGDDVPSSFTQYELNMTKDGDATLTANYELGDVTFEYATNGTWDFENKDEDLKLDFENNDADETYNILRLKEEELWLREKGGDLELHLEPK